MKTKSRDTLYCGVRKDVILSACPVLNWENVLHFKNFVMDRYNIHLQKDVHRNPPPWTENPILQEFKFTNVRREHDRQTRYLLYNIINNDELSLEEKIVNCFLFRCWNNWDTLKAFGFPYSAENLYNPKTKENIRPVYKSLHTDEPGRLWWSNAFMQSGVKMALKFPNEDGSGDLEEDIPLRPFHVGVWLGKNKVVESLLKAKDQQECFEIIKSVKGFSDFLAYQVFVDLSYISDFPFSENEFVVAGPGCKRGLDLIFENKDGMTYEECIFWLRNSIETRNIYYSIFNSSELADGVSKWYEPHTLFYDLPEHNRKMNVMSIENCMCELRKYVKVANGTGRPRNKYKYKENHQ